MHIEALTALAIAQSALLTAEMQLRREENEDRLSNGEAMAYKGTDGLPPVAAELTETVRQIKEYYSPPF